MDGEEFKCACVATHADDCFRIRHNIDIDDYQRELHGECECACHDESNEDDWED